MQEVEDVADDRKEGTSSILDPRSSSLAIYEYVHYMRYASWEETS